MKIDIKKPKNSYLCAFCVTQNILYLVCKMILKGSRLVLWKTK